MFFSVKSCAQLTQWWFLFSKSPVLGSSTVIHWCPFAAFIADSWLFHHVPRIGVNFNIKERTIPLDVAWQDLSSGWGLVVMSAAWRPDSPRLLCARSAYRNMRHAVVTSESRLRLRAASFRSAITDSLARYQTDPRDTRNQVSDSRTPAVSLGTFWKQLRSKGSVASWLPRPHPSFLEQQYITTHINKTNLPINVTFDLFDWQVTIISSQVRARFFYILFHILL